MQYETADKLVGTNLFSIEVALYTGCRETMATELVFSIFFYAVRTPPKHFPTPFFPPLEEEHPLVAPISRPTDQRRKEQQPSHDMYRDFKPPPIVQVDTGGEILPTRRCFVHTNLLCNHQEGDRLTVLCILYWARWCLVLVVPSHPHIHNCVYSFCSMAESAKVFSQQ